MIISDQRRFIFIHNYKVAGNSIARALAPFSNNPRRKCNSFEKLMKKLGFLPLHYPLPYDWHATAKDLKASMKNRFNEFYSFGFVRNPWDYQVSLYTFMLKNEKHPQHQRIKSFSTFDHYIDWRIHEDLHLQKAFFCDEDDNVIVNYVGKFESLKNDFNKVCQDLNIDAELDHRNKSRTNAEFKHYYTQKSLDMVAQAFKKDIELFNYKKPKLN